MKTNAALLFPEHVIPNNLACSSPSLLTPNLIFIGKLSEGYLTIDAFKAPYQ